MPRGDRRLPDACVERLQAADLIIHAGDLSRLAVLSELESYGPPVVAVHGNVDDDASSRGAAGDRDRRRRRRARSPWSTTPARAPGRLARLRRRFPDAEAVVFGHSHIPLHERDPATGFQIFNPGQPDRAPPRPAAHDGDRPRRPPARLTFELIALG